MVKIAFREQIFFDLKKMSKEKVVFFAWLCAVRALPFIGHKGNFDFWDENRKKYLYAIFRALDTSCYYYTAAAANTDAAYGKAVRATANARVVAIRASYAANAADNAADNAANAAANAADSADNADVRAASCAADNAISAAYAALPYAANVTVVIQNIFLKDLKEIQKGGKFFNKDLTEKDSYIAKWYREIFDNFQHALEKEGCKYWGDLYKDIIFNRNFKFDKEALESRMNVPPEIQEDGAAAVASYLEEMEKGATRLNEARIIILGEKGAGKTCLARRLENPDADMTTVEESTAGVDTTFWKPEHENINIHIWDFAGHTVTHAVHKFFLSERCLYIIVYDGRTEGRNRLQYWLNHVKNYGGDSKTFILVNIRDRYIPEIPINSLCEEYLIAGFDTFSIQNDKNDILKFREKVVEYIKTNPSWSRLNIPVSYFKVKKELELRFKGDERIEHIDIDEFNRIAKENEVENTEELLKSLHALGICLRYENIKDFDALVLNPEWISQGVYEIINWVHDQKIFSISIQDFQAIFKNDLDRYPEEKHPFLFELMKRYELAYETENNCLIIPHLLPEDRPRNLPEFSVGISLMLRYKAEQPLPPNTISRFIVRHNEDIIKEKNESLVWRYGVVLEDGKGSTALVREYEQERMITVSVKGNDKTAYLGKLRETLNNIFNSYKIDKPELQYRIERFGQIPDEIDKSSPLWLRDNKIFNHYINNQQYYDDAVNRYIPMQPVVQNNDIRIENLITGGQGNIIDRSVNTLNFYNCNVELQGYLNDLAGSLKDEGETEEARTLENAAKALSEAKECKTPDEIKEKGILNKLKRIVTDLGDENSRLHKTVEGIKYGIGIAQDIAKGYNDIAQWCGMPQVPRPFLKKE